MRRYVRHPSSHPVDIQLKSGRPGTPGQSELRNISDGGLCVHASQAVVPGKTVFIAIPVAGQVFETQAIVVWCSSVIDGYEVGVSFIDEASVFSVRMAEQLCQIELFRRRAESEDGRQLTSEQAAEEWVEKYAADFTRLHS